MDNQLKRGLLDACVLSAIRNTTDEIRLASDVQTAFALLHEFMFDHVYTNPVCKSEEGKAIQMIKLLYEFFCENPSELSGDYIRIAFEEGVERAAVDYIAGMTDDYFVDLHAYLFPDSEFAIKYKGYFD